YRHAGKTFGQVEGEIEPRCHRLGQSPTAKRSCRSSSRGAWRSSLSGVSHLFTYAIRESTLPSTPIYLPGSVLQAGPLSGGAVIGYVSSGNIYTGVVAINPSLKCASTNNAIHPA